MLLLSRLLRQAARRLLPDRTRPRVENLDEAGAFEQQVRRFDIAVNETPSRARAEVRYVYVASRSCRPSRLPTAVFGHQRLQAKAFHVFHHEEQNFPVLAQVVNADDVRVVQNPRRLAASPERNARVRLPSFSNACGLNTFSAIESPHLRMFGEKHLTHSALAE